MVWNWGEWANPLRFSEPVKYRGRTVSGNLGVIHPSTRSPVSVPAKLPLTSRIRASVLPFLST